MRALLLSPSIPPLTSSSRRRCLGAALFALSLVSGSGSVSMMIGCANRGMVTPGRDGGSGGSDGATTETKVDLPGMDLGSGGSGGDGGISDAPRETYEAAPLPCNTRFNFEMGMTYGAKLDPAATGFMSVGATTEHTQCGLGALLIMARFSGTTGPTARGVVLIDLPPAEQNLAGKTLSLGVSAAPPVMPGPTVSVSLITPAGYVDFPTIRNIPGVFFQGSYTVPATATSVSAIVLQATDPSGYTGKLYIDEIDIK